MDEQLRPESHYSDLYDLITIQDCMRTIERWKKVKVPEDNTEYSKNIKVKGWVVKVGCEFELSHIKGRRYQERSTTIRDWMELDRKRDGLLQTVKEPRDVRCSDCHVAMNSEGKVLCSSEKSDRVLFFFECPSCKKRKGIFENGEQRVSKPELCPRCQKALQVLHARRKNVVTTTRRCPACGFKDKDVWDFDKEDAEREVRKREEQRLLKEHRAEFCLSAKEGAEYLDSIDRVKAIHELLDKGKRQAADPDYQKASKTVKWSIVELEKNLTPVLEKHKYQRLLLDKPEISRFVIVPFTVQDAETSRQGRDAECKLQKLLKKTLEGCNWVSVRPTHLA